MGRAGVLVVSLQVVHHREIIALALFAVHGKGVGHVNGGIDVGAGVGGDHAPEQSADEPARQCGAVAKGGEIAPFAATGTEKKGGGFASRFGVARVLVTDGGGLFTQEFHLGQAQQQGLAPGFRRAATAVHADVEGVPNRVENLGGKACAVLQRFNNFALDNVA